MSDDLRLHERVEAYFAARGVDVPVITTGEKAVEEAHELVAALASGDPQQIRNEVADVVIAAALVACQLGVTVGQCIDEKTRRDAGRGEGDHFDGRVLNAETLDALDALKLDRIQRGVVERLLRDAKPVGGES